MPDMMLVPKVATSEMLRAYGDAPTMDHPERDAIRERWDECGFTSREAAEKTVEAEGRIDYAAMTAASPNGGKVTREMLREALNAAQAAFTAAADKPLDQGVTPADWETAQDAEEAALAAALGLQIEEE